MAFFLLHPIAAANLRKPHIFRSHSAPESAAAYTRYFEVTKPISLPKTQPLSYPILKNQEFAYTYEKPPVLKNYKPPSNPSNFSKIVLEWTATSKGRQYDRIFGVWIGGAEVFRSCTAEPRATGTIWTLKKDITRYHSLLTTEQTVSVYMGNVIDSIHDGVYHVNLTFHFYPSEQHHHDSNHKGADLILPISRNLPLNDGLWFKIENSTVLQGNEVKIPQNSYRAVLEVYVSFHENDEFWFGNLPNEYISVNNLTGASGNGPFREVVIHLDGVTVGVVWPFTLIYTGGVNPLFWRPFSGIGSFDLPTYDIEITPFLGKLLDGKLGHKFEFSVMNALNVWYINANLHLWLDTKVHKTRGKLLKHKVLSLSSSIAFKISSSDGLSTINVSRALVSRGWVRSSHGVITTKSIQEFRYSNSMVLKHDGNFQKLDQTIKLKQNVAGKNKSSTIFFTNLRRKFLISFLYDSVENQSSGIESGYANVTLGIDEKSRKVSSLDRRFICSRICKK
ncbi:hypothetical protein ACS0TY_016796 [Phlomoides rotata]